MTDAMAMIFIHKLYFPLLFAAQTVRKPDLLIENTYCFRHKTPIMAFFGNTSSLSG